MKIIKLETILVSLVAVTVVMMAIATFITKLSGIDEASRLIYHNPLFIAAWIGIAIFTMILLIRKKVWKRPVIAAIHASFILILAGALTTHFFSKSGDIHLKVGESTEEPLNIRLEAFDIDYYQGTDTPQDYRSSLEIDGVMGTVSMNKVFKIKGFRFFQMGYDADRNGSTVTYTYDPWGTGLTYGGYFMLLICMTVLLLSKVTIRKSKPLCVLMLLTGLSLHASAMEPRALPKDVSDAFGELEVFYNGRVTSMRSLSTDYVRKVYGKSRVKGMDAVQVMTGWMFYYNTWQDVPVKLKKKDIGTPREDEKYQIMRNVASGYATKLFPYKGSDGEIQWFAPAETLPEDIPADEWVFIKRVISMVGESVFQGDDQSAIEVLEKIHKYQLKTLGDSAPGVFRRKSENLYNTIGLPKIAAMISVTIGILAFLLTGIIPAWLLSTYCWALTSYLSLIIALRWIVSGHIPVTNGSELMCFIALMSMVFAIASGKRRKILYPIGIILSGFSMLVASLGMSSPQITSLMPVLASPLLSIHVGCMMMSYTLFGLAAINSAVSLCRHSDPSMTGLSRAIIYPGTFLLTAGTIIGAIWANVSWGSYWAWDPKETWALITIIIYSFAVHKTGFPSLAKDKTFNYFCIFAFMSVLFTYFGVNYLLGGMHSYA